MKSSIRRRLSLMLLAGVALVWAATIATSFRHASREVQSWEDARLVEFARFAALLDHQDLVRLTRSHIDTRIELPQPQETAERVSDSDLWPREVLLEVRDAQGNIVAASPRLATLDPFPPALQHIGGPSSITLAHTVWRIYTLRDASTGRTIRVMETSNTRSDLAHGAALHITQPLLFALPVLALLVWLAIGRSLAPLRTLSAAIRTRDANMLEPVGTHDVPTEVEPLVEAIDRLLAQLKHSIARERAFTSDAAHELKTPLAAIKVQAQVAMAADDLSLRQLAIERVIQGVDRSARLADQLLLLARLDERDRIPTKQVQLHQLVRNAIVRHSEQARTRHISIAFDDNPVPSIDAEPLLVSILLDNVLDNALKYGRDGGHIRLGLASGDESVRLTVCDDGRGVSASEMSRLTDRFYRGADAPAAGSGLGLSIVARITRYFDGQLTFAPGIDGRGLTVAASFPHTRERVPMPTM